MPRQWPSLHRLSPSNDDPNPSVDVVLVHGLSGHYIDTWKSADDNDDTLWPSDFLPHYLPGVRVLSYSYNASIKGTTSPHMIRNRAHKLLQLLRDRREEGSTAFIPIIFVGHSLGGVIIKQALRIAFDNSAHYREIAISACGVIFFSTPHYLGNLELWKRYVTDVVACHLPGDDPSLPDMSGSDVLKPEHFQNLSQITEDFSSLLVQDPRPFEVIGFLEDDATAKLGRKVVDEDIGRLRPEDMPRTLSGNHIEVCRFGRGEVEFFKEVGSKFQKILEVARSSKRLDDQHRHVLASLCSEQFHAYQLKFVPTEGTCAWINTRPEFQSWRDGVPEPYKNRLWISGEIACGKTYLARYTIRHMCETKQPASEIIQCFLSHRLPERDNLLALLRSTIHQVAVAHPDLISKYLVPRYQEATRTGSATDAWNAEILLQIWPTMISDVINQGKKRLVFIIDGFDAISDEDQDTFLDCFKNCEARCEQQHVCREPCRRQCERSAPRLLILSRNCTSLENVVPAFVKYSITQNDTSEDIRHTVRKKLNRFARHMHYSRKLQEDVCNRLAREARGVYIWATVMIRDLEHRLLTEADLKAQLRTLPKELVELYDEILGRLRHKLNNDAFDVQALLRWVVLRQETLSTTELGIGLALARLRREHRANQTPTDDSNSADGTLVTPNPLPGNIILQVISDWTALRQNESAPYGQWNAQSNGDPRRVIDEKVLQDHKLLAGSAKKALYNFCGQLLRFTEDDVEPIHSSLTDYLTRPTEELEQTGAQAPNHRHFHIPVPDSHAILGNLCATYLTMPEFANAGEPFSPYGDGPKRWEAKVRKRIRDHHFARYASLCWSKHLMEAMNPGVGCFETTAADVRRQKILERTTTRGERSGHATCWLEIWWLLRRWPRLGFPAPGRVLQQIIFHSPEIREGRSQAQQRDRGPTQQRERGPTQQRERGPTQQGERNWTQQEERDWTQQEERDWTQQRERDSSERLPGDRRPEGRARNGPPPRNYNGNRHKMRRPPYNVPGPGQEGNNILIVVPATPKRRSCCFC